MIEPGIAPNEETRLKALRDLHILDTPPEERFDRITRLAQQIFKVPIALVSLIDENRQWFKSCQGLDIEETPRGISFCGHAILGDDVFVVKDAAADQRFADNPLVTGGPRIRFYAGAPLRLNGEHAAGTLCIIAPKPREFGPEDRRLLAELAAVVVAELNNVYLATRERELRDFIETAGAIIQSVDGTGILRMVNRAWTTALGYSPSEVVGKSIFSLLDPSEHEHCRAIMDELRETTAPIELETVMIAKDGRKVRLHGMLTALRRPDSSLSTRGVFQDVTAQRELERIRREVTHHVSHELKTPIAVVTLAVGMLAEAEDNLSQPQRQILATAQRGIEHAARMAEDLLDASRSDSGKLQVTPVPSNLNELLAVIEAAFSPISAKAGLALRVDMPAKPVIANFDPVRLRQVLSNLLGNAMKFTKKGGSITVGAKAGDPGFVEIYVEDTGLGINAADLDRIFDRLYQTTNKALQGESGLGLGLHICRELISAHGGRIRVDSEPGKGTKFQFSLPLT